MGTASSLSNQMRRKLSRLHRQMDAADASGGVTPTPEIVNRRTGYVQKFGPRRAFDGAYVGEVLAALLGVKRDMTLCGANVRL